jgi:hypothetical protein
VSPLKKKKQAHRALRTLAYLARRNINQALSWRVVYGDDGRLWRDRHHFKR